MEELIKKVKAQPRMLSAMKPVLKNPSVALEADRVVYDVYRNAGLAEDMSAIQANNVRYDITKIYPKRLGNELPKTFGHCHLGKYVEVMEVISGQALWLIQKHEENEPAIIKEVYLIEGSENEKMIILPHFAISSMNPGKETELILSNWLSPDLKNNYEHFKEFHGPCYYIIKNEKGETISEKNPNYKEVPELIKLKPKEVPELGLLWSKSLYSLIKTPETLAFLNYPEKFKEILTIERCYKRA